MKTIKYILLFFLSLFTISTANGTYIASKTYTVHKDNQEFQLPYSDSRSNIESPNHIEHVVLVMHGIKRNADHYFNIISPILEKKDNYLIIAPQFITETEIEQNNLSQDYPFRSEYGRKHWSKSQSTSANPRQTRISSFEIIDLLLEQVTKDFANVKKVTLIGHSAGWQFVHRYAATTQNTLINKWVDVRYIVWNPSSYLYFDKTRPIPWSTTNFAIPNTSCKDYNQRRYWLGGLFYYPGLSSKEEIIKRYKNSTVSYLLGSEDIIIDQNLDTNCEANLQGKNRLERWLSYYNYLKKFYWDAITNNHKLFIIDWAWHSPSALFQSSIAKQLLLNSTHIPNDYRPTNSDTTTINTIISKIEPILINNPSLRWKLKTALQKKIEELEGNRSQENVRIIYILSQLVEYLW